MLPQAAMTLPRFELMPLEGAWEQIPHLPGGATVTVTCSPARGIENTLRFSEELSGAGFRVVPHLSARLVAGEAHLKEILRRLARIQAREVFVIGGDVREPAGPFAGAFELLSAIEDLGGGFEIVGVAGYPERHPTIPDADLRRTLRDKQRFATHVVTQMCFDPEKILDWVSRIREEGIRLPVYVGIPGAVDRGKLLRVSLRIGVGDSIRFLKGHAGLVAGLMRRGGYSPDELVEAIAPYIGDPYYDIRGFHVFTFNQVERTERWRRRMSNGEVGDGRL